MMVVAEVAERNGRTSRVCGYTLKENKRLQIAQASIPRESSDIDSDNCRLLSFCRALQIEVIEFFNRRDCFKLRLKSISNGESGNYLKII